jgi:hypothetical protein
VCKTDVCSLASLWFDCRASTTLAAAHLQVRDTSTLLLKRQSIIFRVDNLASFVFIAAYTLSSKTAFAHLCSKIILVQGKFILVMGLDCVSVEMQPLMDQLSIPCKTHNEHEALAK